VVELFLFLSVLANAQCVLPGEIEYPTMDPCRQGGCWSPKFNNGYFIQLHDYKASVPPDGYELWGPDGSFLYHISTLAPDGTPARVIDVRGIQPLPRSPFSLSKSDIRAARSSVSLVESI
jgi:hypothetical protein